MTDPWDILFKMTMDSARAYHYAVMSSAADPETFFWRVSPVAMESLARQFDVSETIRTGQLTKPERLLGIRVEATPSLPEFGIVLQMEDSR